ncbi:MAG: hypothetical protein J6Q79_04245 [Clostridia bacterium]|nr:hypothetical protein [Clostridia bacterium]
MMSKQKRNILFIASMIICLVVVSSFAVSNRESTASFFGELFTSSADYQKDYSLSDTSIAQLSNSLLRGIDGDQSAYTSVNAVVTLDDNIFVSDGTGRKIFRLSQSGEIEATYASTVAVNSIATDGSYIYALTGTLDGAVVKLTKNFDILCVTKVGHTPCDMVFAKGKAYVVNRFSNDISVINTADMAVADTLKIDGREPVCAVTAGNYVYVACHLPDESTDEAVMSANLAVLSADTDDIVKTLPLVNGSSGVKDICISPDMKTVYISHIVGRYAYPTTQLDRAWINSNCVSVVDTKSQTVTCSVLLDEVDKGAANPWGVTVSSDGKYLCVALSGLDEVMLIDRAKMHSRIDDVVNKKSTALVNSADVIVDYLPFLNDCRERIAVGKGVRAIAEKNGVLYCGLYFDGRVDAINLKSKKVTSLSFISQPEANEVRKGHILWSDATLCYQGWQSCNSCHPDAVVDGFNWDNLNDGLGGGGKNTKSMLYSHRTPPVMSTGIRANAEIAVGAGMKFIQFNTLDEENLMYIDEYLKSLSPVPSPYLNKDGTLTESAEAGKMLFEQSCASCHPAPLYTNNKLYDVGTKHFSGDSGKYDVPTLNEVWRTAPYMHDGSMNTIEEVVRYFAKDLSEKEVTQLADYVRSIGAEGEYYALEQIRVTADDGSEIYNKYLSGATVNTIIVRKQSAAAKDAIVNLTVSDKDGNEIFTKDYALPTLGYNASYVIQAGENIILPEGGSYAVSFRDADGNALATTLIIK